MPANIPGQQHLFTVKEENVFVAREIVMCLRGFPLTTWNLSTVAKVYLYRYGRAKTNQEVIDMYFIEIKKLYRIQYKDGALRFSAIKLKTVEVQQPQHFIWYKIVKIQDLVRKAIQSELSPLGWTVPMALITTKNLTFFESIPKLPYVA